jgi:hypothetical protein
MLSVARGRAAATKSIHRSPTVTKQSMIKGLIGSVGRNSRLSEAKLLPQAFKQPDQEVDSHKKPTRQIGSRRAYIQRRRQEHAQ